MSQDQRRHLVVAMLFVVGTVLSVRLIQLQLTKSEFLAERAVRQRRHTELIEARPGDIVDRNGRLLAVSVRRPSLYVVPKRVRDASDFARQLATAIDIDADRLADRIVEHRAKEFLWVQRRLGEEEEASISALNLPADVWGFREEFARHYPQGSLATHVLGIRDIDNEGRGGIEQKCQNQLKGKAGRRVIIRDARGHAIDIPNHLEEPPIPGRTIVLSIDSAVQLFAEQALDDVIDEFAPKGACAIVLDVPTSELLAMASRPTFDPNRASEVPPDAWTNRAISDVYEPGSTFKPLVVAWALQNRLIEEQQIFDCEGGVYRTGRRILHDHHGYGALSLTDVLVKSSNIGMAKIGEQVGLEGLHRCVLSFGFGQLTGVSLPGEQRGTVRPLREWNDYSIGSVPMGHEIAVTPLQLIAAHSVLANGGKLVPPRLVIRDIDPVLGDSPQRVLGPDKTSGVSSQVVDRDTAAWVVQDAMTAVVERGTGRAAQLDGFNVFGKTGTAQKFDAKTGTFSHSRHIVSFIAGAPAKNPRVLVLVVVDEPAGASRSGGTVAAPAVADILRRTIAYLGITPNRPAVVADRARGY